MDQMQRSRESLRAASMVRESYPVKKKVWCNGRVLAWPVRGSSFNPAQFKKEKEGEEEEPL